MMNNLRTITILIISLVLFGESSIAKTVDSRIRSGKIGKKYANRRLLVRYNEDAPLNKVDEAHFSVGAFVVKSYELPTNLEVVEVAKGISIDSALEFYRENPNIKYAEPDYEYHAFMQPPPTETPRPEEPNGPNDDPELKEQWGLNNVGQEGGKFDADINAPEMWAMLPGDSTIVTAVIDTGINTLHPDLNLWTNAGEIPNNGIDDDGNGVIDDIHGFNALAENGDPMDDHGHGSHCAGIIGAKRGNNIGGSGVNPLGQVIGCKFLNADGSGSASGAIDCLRYIANLKRRSENPVNVIATSNSWGGGPASQALEDAIREHKDLGILFIAASSNDGDNNDEIEMYPANYNLANIISVGATDNHDQLTVFSNYGKRTVHIAAPGTEILSTVLGSAYEKMSGTSMATPFVAGLATMIKAHDQSLNYLQVKNLLIAGGTPLESLEGKIISGRRIRAVGQNGEGSLTCRDQIVTGRLSPTQDRLLVGVGEHLLLSAININCAEPNGAIVVQMQPQGKKFTLADNGLGLDSAANDGVYTYDWKPEEAGRYEFLFPNNDVVVVNVYDPAKMRAYNVSIESSFNYRNFEGTPLSAGDDSVITIAAPFPLRFGDIASDFEELTIDANGVMSVTGKQAVGFNNEALPFTQKMSLIAPLWDDLQPGLSGGEIYVASLGEAPHRELVVEWRNVRHYSSTKGVTFQVVFFENDTDVLFNYLDVDFKSATEDNGGSATVGIQTSPSRYHMVSFNESKLENRMGLRFSLTP